MAEKTFRKSNKYKTSLTSGIHYFHYMETKYHTELAELMASKISLPFQYPFKVDHWIHDHHIIYPKTDPVVADSSRLREKALKSRVKPVCEQVIFRGFSSWL